VAADTASGRSSAAAASSSGERLLQLCGAQEGRSCSCGRQLTAQLVLEVSLGRSSDTWAMPDGQLMAGFLSSLSFPVRDQLSDTQWGGGATAAVQ